MGRNELISKICAKKEFSNLPKEDVERAFEKVSNESLLDEEKIKLTRNLLRKIYTAFLSEKILNAKNKDAEWFLKKHLSTRERLPYYEKIYERVFKNLKGKVYVYDLGCGVNGFSYPFLSKINKNIFYRGVEAVGQLISVQKNYFEKEKHASFFSESLFVIDKIKKIISKDKGKKVLFLFKVIDSLESLERNFSKKFLLEISGQVDEIVLSFASQSLGRGKKFFADRNWLKDFLMANFNILDDFKYGGEQYFIFTQKDL